MPAHRELSCGLFGLKIRFRFEIQIAAFALHCKKSIAAMHSRRLPLVSGIRKYGSVSVPHRTD
jgi:hypothetical protein